MSQKDLLSIYMNILRPSAEYCSAIYHSLIPEYMAAKLESVQRQAMKIVFGWQVNYEELLGNGTIETLEKRRQDNALKFALKASNSARFGRTWFTETPITEREVRNTTRKKYIEKFTRTERGRSNPLSYLTRRLNEHHCT